MCVVCVVCACACMPYEMKRVIAVIGKASTCLNVCKCVYERYLQLERLSWWPAPRSTTMLCVCACVYDYHIAVAY